MATIQKTPNHSLRSNQPIQFKKYTSCGNTFIIIDESFVTFAGDQQRSLFSRRALDGKFGIGGADNVLFIQSLDIKERYSDYTFRIFEYDGSETLMCGNGLLSVAEMLYCSTGRSKIGVMTELPTGHPKRLEIGVENKSKVSWVNLGFPSSAPPTYCRCIGKTLAPNVMSVDPFVITFPNNEEWVTHLPKELILSGVFIFTGEPHLVFLLDHGLSSEWESMIWLDKKTAHDTGKSRVFSKEMSKNLIHYIGSFVNSKYRSLFPQGVHLNFARVNNDRTTIDYRTYERAINCETMACGSGAVAVANVCWVTGVAEKPSVTLRPHRCNWSQPHAKLKVSEASNGSILSGLPELIYEGIIPASVEMNQIEMMDKGCYV